MTYKCLFSFQYIQNLPNDVNHLICYSDSCGGQNKNKNIAKLCMFLVQGTHVNKIDHKFFEPGHSYMECDRSFGLIEKNTKKNPQIFIPDHWADMIRKTNKNFEVTLMTSKDFISFQYLNDIMKDPKRDTAKNILKWRENVWFAYRQEQLMTFSFKSTRSENFPFINSENCSKLTKGRPVFNINKLTENVPSEIKKISYLKWENLISLIEFIPPAYHDFYKNLPHEEKNSKKKQTTNSENLEVEEAPEENAQEDPDEMGHILDSDSDGD